MSCFLLGRLVLEIHHLEHKVTASAPKRDAVKCGNLTFLVFFILEHKNVRKAPKCSIFQKSRTKYLKRENE
jgi:hypothetical protein